MAKVAICTPARDMVHGAFAFDLCNLVGHTARQRRELELGAFITMGTLICNQRSELARQALAGGAEWLMFIDSDMRFPSDSLLRLLAHRRDIVAANYVTRAVPPEPTATRVSDDGTSWSKVATLSASRGLEEVTGCGMGLMLINARVFARLERPWFHIGYSTVNHEHLGEDLYFSLKAHDAGFTTLIDHDLSKQTRHIGSFEFTWDHYEATRDMAAGLEAAS